MAEITGDQPLGVDESRSIGIISIHMEFEFDPAKSESNRAKHGIDFVAAQRLWEDMDVLEIPARTEDEPRYVVVGRIDGKHWSAVITYREERVRVISVRRSRKTEIELYEGE
jgi:uncharacterized DUF497 family protein